MAAPRVLAACPGDWCALQDPRGVPAPLHTQWHVKPSPAPQRLGAPVAMPRTRLLPSIPHAMATEQGTAWAWDVPQHLKTAPLGLLAKILHGRMSLLASWREGAVLTHLVLVQEVHRGHVAWYCSGCVLVRRALGKQPAEPCCAGRAGSRVTPLRLASSCTCVPGARCTGQEPGCRPLARAAPCGAWLGVPGQLPARGSSRSRHLRAPSPRASDQQSCCSLRPSEQFHSEEAA